MIKIYDILNEVGDIYLNEAPKVDYSHRKNNLK